MFIKTWRNALFIMAIVEIAVNSTLLYAQVPGTFDTSFNGTGYIESFTFRSNLDNESATSIAQQADGKIVVAGQCRNDLNSYAVCLARFNPDGSLDESFDGPDASGTGVGNGRGKFQLAIGSPNRSVRQIRLALQRDGKIVVALGCVTDDGSTASVFCLARLNANGSYDASFDGPGANGVGLGSGRGRFTLPAGSRSSFDDFRAIAIDASGRLAIVGTCTISLLTYFCMARLLRDGRFDETFDGPDVAQTGVGNGNGRFVLPLLDPNAQVVGFESASAIAVQSDGRIVLSGKCDNKICVARLRDDGSFDAGFGRQAPQGRSIISVNNAYADAMSIQGDGKIALAGQCIDGKSNKWRSCVARLREDGALDERMASASGAYPALLASTNPLEQSGLSAVWPQSDGRWIVAGECYANFDNRSICIARLSADDVAYDKTFGDAATLPNQTLLQIGSNVTSDFADAVVQSDGKLLVLGRCRASSTAKLTTCIARIHTGALAGRECSLDIDGDGRINALTDGLINTRIALGLTGNAVTNGVQFAANAQRTNWPSIRNYLVTRCEMSLP
jgi:uncharacterized delta-60 repeat protein